MGGELPLEKMWRHVQNLKQPGKTIAERKGKKLMEPMSTLSLDSGVTTAKAMWTKMALQKPEQKQTNATLLCSSIFCCHESQVQTLMPDLPSCCLSWLWFGIVVLVVCSSVLLRSDGRVRGHCETHAEFPLTEFPPLLLGTLCLLGALLRLLPGLVRGSLAFGHTPRDVASDALRIATEFCDCTAALATEFLHLSVLNVPFWIAAGNKAPYLCGLHVS